MRYASCMLGLLVLMVLAPGQAATQTRIVTGTITDAATNEPLDDTQVLVPNTNIIVDGRPDGTFSIGVPVGVVTIVVRRIGYKRFSITLPANRNTFDAAMEEDVLQLEGVVVTGQATGVERRNLANAISTVSAVDMERAPAPSVEQQIQGKVAGANIQSNSDAPGGGVQVELRGVTSINATAQPLYVVDGLIVSDVAISSNINAVTAAAGGSNPALTQDNQVNRIVDINPNDIENIEILKGPSAAAIYGSQASSGVIIITTKRGRSGRPQINLSQRFGFFDLANTLGFRPRDFSSAAEVDAEFGLDAGTASSYGYQPGQVFDLEEALAGRNALSHETSGSITGGDENTRYFASALWKNDEGVMTNTGFGKQSLRLNVDQSIGERLLLQLNSNLIHSLASRGVSNNDNAGVSPYMVYAFTPNVFDLSRCRESDYRPICADVPGTYPANPFERSNPLETVGLMENDEDVWRMIGSGRIDWDPIASNNHALKLIGVGGVDRFSQKNALLFPPELQFEDDDGLPGTSLLSNSDVLNINLSASAVHTFTPGSGAYTATTSAGIQYNTTDLNTSRITSQNTVPGQSNVNAATVFAVNELRQRTENLGYYLQEEVLIDDRLLITAGIRADQSSANSDDSQLFFYPKAAASYRMTVGSGLVEEVKFRAAYGESGNMPIYGAKFTPLTATVNIGGLPGFQVQGPVVVTDIEPERQREIEGGVDATLLAGRARVEATVFHKQVTDLILFRQLAPSSGFGQEVFNGGSMRVNGIEASLALVPLQSPDFTWLFRTQFSHNRSLVTDLPVPAFLPPNAGFGAGLGSFKIEEGQSATQIVGTVPDGSGGTTIAKVGDSNPDFKVAFTNDVSWGPLSLYFMFDWQQGSQIVNLTRLLYDAGANSDDYDVVHEPSGDPIGQHRISTFGNDIRVYIEDATYLKFREVTLSYDLPRDLVTSLWDAVEYARLTLSGRNLFTATPYSGMDPEVSNFGNQAIGRNIDVARFPRTRSWWLGIDLGF